MRPGIFIPRKLAYGMLSVRHSLLGFNEAGDFHPQKAASAGHAARRHASFNEAGDFHPQKAKMTQDYCLAPGCASMRPGIFIPRKIVSRLRYDLPLLELQ